MLRNDHTAFRVRDLDRALDFYTGILGMRFLFRETDEAHGEAFAYLELEGGNLELLQSLDGTMPPVAEPVSYTHLTLPTNYPV